MKRLIVAVLLAWGSVTSLWAQGTENLEPLVEVLKQSDDAALQVDVLRGIQDALKGKRDVKMPAGWEELAEKLLQSPNAEVKSLVQNLSVQFGSKAALVTFRNTLQNPAATAESRRAALSSLLTARDPELVKVLPGLLKEASLRGAVLRGMASYEDPALAKAILDQYPDFSAAEKKDALNTMASRQSFAKLLIAGVDSKSIPRTDVTAEVIRQLRTLKQEELNTWIEKSWGVARESAAEKLQEMERFKKLVQQPAKKPDIHAGRAVFAKTCQQCHGLFGLGGKVGPDLTGSARADLDYILQNMVDPNAVIPNDYRSSTLETKDDRVITGIVKNQDANGITIASPNETLTISRTDVKSLTQNELSMMPEGLLAQLSESEVRDLIAYLGQSAQVPMRITAENTGSIFNELDLSYWQGNPDLWKVQNGEIVGTSRGMVRNEFLRGQHLLGDFRLIVEVKLTPNKENSGIQFRSQELPEGEVKGYQADMGQGWWGRLYEEHGRAVLWEKTGEEFVKNDDWNTYEIVAVGDKILTALNGKKCVDLTDPQGAKEGIIAFQLHAGGPLEVRFRKFRLEVEGVKGLSTVK